MDILCAVVRVTKCYKKFNYAFDLSILGSILCGRLLEILLIAWAIYACPLVCLGLCFV